MKIAIFFAMIISLLIFSSCSSEPVEIEVTRLVEVPVEVTRFVTQLEEVDVKKSGTSPVEATHIVIATASPVPTDELAHYADPGFSDVSQQWAINYLGSGESAGVTVEVVRVLFANRDAPIISDIESWPENFGSNNLIGLILLRVSNNTDQTIQLDALSDGAIQVNNEQINLRDYWLANVVFGDDLSEDILPNATVIGGIWFPVQDTGIDEISTITYYSGKVIDAGTDETLGRRIAISAAVPAHVFEPWPGEIEDLR